MDDPAPSARPPSLRPVRYSALCRHLGNGTRQYTMLVMLLNRRGEGIWHVPRRVSQTTGALASAAADGARSPVSLTYRRR